MFPRTVLLCLLACSAAASAYRVPETGYQTHRFKRSDFGDVIRDWFRNIRDRMFGSLFHTERPRQQEPVDTFQLETAGNPERFFVDVSTLTFNPQLDWGFRIGNWYLIRKENINPEDSSNPRVETPKPVIDSWNDVTEQESDTTKNTKELEGSKEPFGETITQKETSEASLTTTFVSKSSPEMEITESLRTEFGPEVTMETLSSKGTESVQEVTTESLHRETTELENTDSIRTEITESERKMSTESEGKTSSESGEIQTDATVPVRISTTESGSEENLESVERKIVTESMPTTSTIKFIENTPDDSVNYIKEKKHFTADSKTSGKREPSSVEIIGP